MHVPKGDTAKVRILSFEEALSDGRPVPYDRSGWLYVPCTYEEYRYVLGTVGENPLICVGINPSTAEPDHLDNTLKSVERIAKFNGFDSFLMFNVYAQRATDPDAMEKTFNPALHRENLLAFRYLLCRSPKPVIWAAWGKIIEKRPYLKTCLADLIREGREAGAVWVCAGERSKVGGHPHHPLYLKKDSVLAPFDVESYREMMP